MVCEYKTNPFALVDALHETYNNPCISVNFVNYNDETSLADCEVVLIDIDIQKEEIDEIVNNLDATVYQNKIRKQEILLELEKLDKEVPRVLEDVIEQGQFVIHESKLAVIAEKESLRQELAELEAST